MSYRSSECSTRTDFQLESAMVKMKKDSKIGSLVFIGLVALSLALYILTCMYIRLDSVNETESTIRAKLAMEEISSNINASLDPCDDFYQFACGSFNKKYPLLNNRTEFNYNSLQLDQMYRRTVENLEGDVLLSNGTLEPLKYIKNFWDSCVQDNSSTDDQMKKVTEYFKELDTLDTWQSKFIKLTQDGYEVFFTVKTATHPNELAEVAIGNPELAFSDVKTADDVGPLLGYYSSLISLFKDNTGEDRYRLAQQIVDFENFLRSIMSSPREKARGPLHLMVRLNEMRGLTKINWNSALEQIFKVSEQPVTEFSVAIVEDIKYIKGFKKVIESKDEAFLSDYLKILVLHQSCFSLGQKCRANHFRLAKSFKKVEDEEDHKKRFCFDVLKKHLEPLLFKAYDPTWPPSPPDEVARVENMTKIVVERFKYLIGNFTWMDEETKKKTIEAVGDIQFRMDVRAPAFLQHQLDIKTKFWDAPYIKSTDRVVIYDYFTSIIKFTRKKNFRIHERRARTQWPMSLFSASPQFDQLRRYFYVPEFFAYGPFSSPDLPDQIKFGLLGSLLAHEITHSFDGLADRWSEVSRNHLWSDWTKDKFNEKMQCLVDVYKSQEVDGPYKINGSRTLNENLADLIGLNVAFEIFKNGSRSYDPKVTQLPDAIKDMNEDQLFFLSYANSHCSNDVQQAEVELDIGLRPPRKYRVNVPLAQTEKFAQAFSCKEGSRMNPTRRCSFN